MWEPRHSADESGAALCEQNNGYVAQSASFDWHICIFIHPSSKRRNEGTIAASLCCFAMVNYDCRLEHLPVSPDSRAAVVEG
ncbi:hypothetical protein Q5P01_006649 [Channa striata]|uniref:Uncharacterized protein n=1 Tax=Channa striata TaxID=64152 RepID=A0AA88NHR5_CHASR|nr:hypothetical protein Q5P01_006649 [Channa striata]